MLMMKSLVKLAIIAIIKVNRAVLHIAYVIIEDILYLQKRQYYFIMDQTIITILSQKS